ncbi:hypothetical protein AAHF61_005032 [Salmonella enterica]
MNSFFERYKPVFEIVARLLGNGWRVNRLACQSAGVSIGWMIASTG